ncbi:MAG: hypothetical protein V3U25_01045 [Nitrososphaerales archaeon]
MAHNSVNLFEFFMFGAFPVIVFVGFEILSKVRGMTRYAKVSFQAYLTFIITAGYLVLTIYRVKDLLGLVIVLFGFFIVLLYQSVSLRPKNSR